MSLLSQYSWLRFRLEFLLALLWALVVLICSALIFYMPGFFIQTKVEPIEVLNFELMGQGPFSLNPQYLNPKTPKVLDTLYAKIGSKVVFKEGFIHVGIQGSHFLQKLPLNQVTPLMAGSVLGEEGDEVLAQWSLKPICIQSDSLVLEAYRQGLEPIMVTLPIFNEQPSHDLMCEPAIIDLKKARSLGVDQLMNDQSVLVHRLCFHHNRVINITSGQELCYVNGLWQQGSYQNSFKAQVVIEGDRVSMVVSDPSGFQEVCIGVDKVPDEVINVQNLIPQEVKVYPHQVMSCYLGAQKLILKEHDWILKTGQFFQILRSKADIKALVEFQKIGPLVIIDQIKILKQTAIIKGRIFSPLRMSVHSFEMEEPLVIQQKQIGKNKVRKVKKL